jgi:hypothetical protein
MVGAEEQLGSGIQGDSDVRLGAAPIAPVAGNEWTTDQRVHRILLCRPGAGFPALSAYLPNHPELRDMPN